MASRRASVVWRKIGLVLFMLCSAALTMSAAGFQSAEGTLIIAHRGASGYAPENTMAAFELAERLGADFIEFDVQMSKDGELVVIHDVTVDRTTAFIGNVNHYTLSELQGMDAGSYSHANYADETILSFQEVMSRFAGKIGMLIEIKNPTLYPGIEEKAADVVRRYGPRLKVAGLRDTDRLQRMVESKNSSAIIMQSFDRVSLRRIHSLLPEIPVAVLVHKDQHPLSGDTLDELASYASYINYSHDLLDGELVREIHKRSRKVMAWTVRNERDMERMKKLGVDGIITDFPG
ncbi:glycerophosphodiester phosphodiesterase family protein [Paenibacillus sp. LHD-38]|uniref:glycerophosphodiester phosphodiesterase n=1 Tax=Paenibacillus sp. LHD-38 TaxID=3072143 RepID=UPI00280EA530|nr:glycerophosphodiester phosphodiesterase family protein [Paenibacillus sp. LHD-38]MDQ8735692.1 glycerophosphodiester phosphodiesterase family protein [Paenibacillus sp. LHD-38]